MNQGRWCLFLLTPLLATGLLLADTPAVRLDSAELNGKVQAILAEHGDGIEASVWVGGPDGKAWYALKADVLMPSASAIKTAYLVELFAAFAGKLDQPLLGLADVLKDEHPAVAHFPEAVREEIRKGLTGATVQRVGEVMIGKTKAANAVYNAAANVTTAALGGPKELTKKLHERDAAFRYIHARRYMLAARNVTGDNEATAEALAAVLQRLAVRRITGIEAKTLEAIREVLRQPEKKGEDTHFAKHGALDSDPLTRVLSGWYETKRGPVVYVVMTRQPGPGKRPRPEAGKRLMETTRRLKELVVSAARGTIN